MADIFLSYSHVDQAHISSLAADIEAAGYSVWWDHHIAGGIEYSDEIETELLKARLVLVAWSADSIKSTWVRDEADAARGEGKLLPISIDGSLPPLGFRQFQTIDHRETSLNPALKLAIEAKIQNPRSGQAVNPVQAGKLKRGTAAILASLIVFSLLSFAAYRLWFTEVVAGSLQTESAGVAVYPFQVLGPNVEEHLGQGLASTLSHDLSILPNIRIIAGTSAAAMSERAITSAELKASFNTDFLIEGEIQQENRGLNVTARLIDTAGGEQVWTEKLSGNSDELQSIQEQLVRELAAALQTRLGLERQTPLLHQRISPRAYVEFLRGLDAINRRNNTGDDQARREGYQVLNRAATLAPDSPEVLAARAYLGLLSNPTVLRVSPDQKEEIVKRDFEAALSIDPDNALALSAKARWLAEYEVDLEQAQQIALQVLEKDPDFVPAQYAMVFVNLIGGSSSELRTWADRLSTTDPFNGAQLFAKLTAEFQTNDYRGFKEFLDNCDHCPLRTVFWGYALSGLATPAEALAERAAYAAAIQADAPPDFAEAYIEIVNSVAEERPANVATVEWMLGRNLPEIALAARSGAVDRALESAATLLGTPDSITNTVPVILVDARISFPPVVRADPRYHALFESEQARKLVAWRRAQGNLAGLPLTPEEVPSEEARLQELGF